MTKHEKYPQMTVHINFLFCFLLHFKDSVNELIILDGCMLFIKRPTMMCLADPGKKKGHFKAKIFPLKFYFDLFCPLDKARFETVRLKWGNAEKSKSN